jgi:WD40 repeat protein
VASGKAVFKWKTRLFAPVAFSRDGARLAVGGGEGDTIRIYQTRTGVLVRELPIQPDDVGTRQLAFLPGGDAIALAGYLGTLRVMDVQTGVRLADCVGHAGEVTSVDVSETGTTMVSVGSDTTLRLWEVSTGRQIQSIKTGDGPVWRVRFAGADRALTWGGDHIMRCFDLETRQERWRVPTPGMWHGEFSKDGKIGLLGEMVGGVRVWSLPPLR